jgi:Sodium Bile acid symporter family
MTAAMLVMLALRTSVFLIVFSLGLRATRADVLYLLSRPGRLSRSLLAMNIAMPLLAVGLSLAFGLSPAVKTALVALSLAPVPPILPKKEFKAGGHGSYVIGLLAAAALLSIIFIPVAEHFLRRLFDVGVDPGGGDSAGASPGRHFRPAPGAGARRASCESAQHVCDDPARADLPGAPAPFVEGRTAPDRQR